ncbi:hypothetical protein FQV26_09595 [Planococcus sp. CPCC 101016]|uniref:hypothetical protein n=1 Tax=Planococcus sp. CPCC 101016 TaxID=2599617 RepID=UPI0011B460E5|nr:hypothetical protein [Planococcus sp. CPCC 101016]TWT08043.1 hypothetical protein FQV26_09595 [Planococcus sp. CPCC 101016]
MKRQCDLVMDGINRSLPFEQKREESVDKQLAYFWERKEFFEVMSKLPYLVDARAFSSDMRARILAMVFDEESGCVVKQNNFHKQTAYVPILAALFLSLVLRNVLKERN